MRPVTQFTTTDDGFSIGYWTLGEGPPLIFSPQPMMTSAVLELEIDSSRRFYERLARTRRVVRFDHRGTGQSDRDVDDFSIECLERDLDAVVRALGVEQVDMWALEDAASLAVRYAARHPDVVSHLVLWGSWAHPDDVIESEALVALEDLIMHNFPMWLESAMTAIWRWPGPEGAAYARGLQHTTSAANVRNYLAAAWT